MKTEKNIAGERNREKLKLQKLFKACLRLLYIFNGETKVLQVVSVEKSPVFYKMQRRKTQLDN